MKQFLNEKVEHNTVRRQIKATLLNQSISVIKYKTGPILKKTLRPMQ